MSESEIWQIIQTGNEISVMRTEVQITITVGVLIIASLRAIQLNPPLLTILLGAYLSYGWTNFGMLISEMHILIAGIEQLASMQAAGIELSNMGQYLAMANDDVLKETLIPSMYAIYSVVTVATIGYAIWQYRRQRLEEDA